MSQTTTQAGAGQDLQAGFLHIPLGLTQSIDGTPAQVFDGDGNSSPLYLETNAVIVGQQAQPTGVGIFQVRGNVDRGHLLGIYNGNTQAGQSPEASIHYENIAEGGGWWNVGVGGKPGPMTFFFWNSNLHDAALAIDKDGNLTAHGSITATGGIKLDAQTALLGIPSVTTAPQGADLASVVVDRTTGKLYAI